MIAVITKINAKKKNLPSLEITWSFEERKQSKQDSVSVVCVSPIIDFCIKALKMSTRS